jgi:hypothetical protein
LFFLRIGNTESAHDRCAKDHLFQQISHIFPELMTATALKQEADQPLLRVVGLDFCALRD